MCINFQRYIFPSIIQLMLNAIIYYYMWTILFIWFSASFTCEISDFVNVSDTWKKAFQIWSKSFLTFSKNFIWFLKWNLLILISRISSNLFLSLSKEASFPIIALRNMLTLSPDLCLLQIASVACILLSWKVFIRCFID